MKASLIILIVLVVIVLIVILMSSPTCRNAVTGVFKGKPKVENKPKLAPPAPGPIVEKQAEPIMNGKVISSPSSATPQPFVNGKVLSQPDLPQVAPTAAPAPAAEKPAKVLSGNLFEMLNPSVDVQAEYGISEEELNMLAKKYKEDHLETPKPEVIRSRHLTRSGVENAERTARQSFITASGTGKREDSEQFYTEVMRDKLMPEMAPSKIKTKSIKRRK